MYGLRSTPLSSSNYDANQLVKEGKKLRDKLAAQATQQQQQQVTTMPKTGSRARAASSTRRGGADGATNNNNKQETVSVYLRLRPLKVDQQTLIKVNEQQVKAVCPDESGSARLYSFTKVFDEAPQSELFEKVARPVVEDFVNSAKDGLIFTYGITGSGKTYTMEGLRTDPGLIYRTIDFLFNSIGSHQTRKGLIESDGQNFYRIQEQLYPSLKRTETPSTMPSVVKWQNRTKEKSSTTTDPNAYYCLFISLIELYNKQVFDLFEEFDSSLEKDKRKREIRTDQRGLSYVANAVELEVKSADEAVEWYTRGVKRRRTGATLLNQESSRGHCVLNLKLVQVRKSLDGAFDENTLVSSQLSLVDLAGSERAKRSGATGGAVLEAGNINNSLGALRKCIRALRDREPTSSVQYREYSLTRLFKSYFEGHGSVCMVLCVKPTVEDFVENNIAMEFGLMTQEVAVDYASPPKMFKRSRSRLQDEPSCALLYEYLNRKLPSYNPSEDFGEDDENSDDCSEDVRVIRHWIKWLKRNRDIRKRYIEAGLEVQSKVRDSLVQTRDENEYLKSQYETSFKDLTARQEQIKMLEKKLGSTLSYRDSDERLIKSLELDNTKKSRCIQDLEAKLNKMKQDKEETYRLLTKMKRLDDKHVVHPSAPKMNLQSSSPIDVPTTSDTNTDSNTPPPSSTTDSIKVMEYPRRDLAASSLATPDPALVSPTSGKPVLNPRHNRSLSCSNMQWIHHKPSGTIDLGTVLKPKFKNGISVKNLRSSDILRKDAAGYSVVHQDADSNGDVNTSIYKGHIISTVCGGAQVILDDIETMRQVSPKRKRAVSDAHYTR